MMRIRQVLASGVVGVFLFGGTVATVTAGDVIELVVTAGRPLRVMLDKTDAVKRVGQPVSGTILEPVYAFDRIVVPAGAAVRGHIAALQPAARALRLRTSLAGDFSPQYTIVLQFDRLILEDGTEIPLQTRVISSAERVGFAVAAPSGQPGIVARAREEVAQRVKQRVSIITAPGKGQRLKQLLLNQLPYHRRYLHGGAVYTAELLEPLHFGWVEATEPAPSATAPAPESILNARLTTALESGRSPRGTVLQAVLTQPVFSADHRLILPEGTSLTGEVTFAKRARRFHRNGQLRFLIERAEAPNRPSAALLASLYSVEASRDTHVVVDDEGGTSIANPKTRFIAPAVALLALRGAADHNHYHVDDAIGGRGAAGFLGFGLTGIVLSQISQPVAIAIGVWGFGRTLYANVLSKGQEVSFPVGTPIQVQLSPGASPSPIAPGRD